MRYNNDTEQFIFWEDTDTGISVVCNATISSDNLEYEYRKGKFFKKIEVNIKPEGDWYIDIPDKYCGGISETEVIDMIMALNFSLEKLKEVNNGTIA